jgi:tetratricopeptide (TPR) repeat protein
MGHIVSTTLFERPTDGQVPEGLPHRLALNSIPVGRDIECSFLENSLDAARDGQGRFILISGKAGMGKSRMVGELLCSKDNRDVGRIVVGFCCFQKRMTPYYPFRQVMNILVGEAREEDPGQRIVSPGRTASIQFPWAIPFEQNGFSDGEGSDRQGVIRQKLFYTMCQYLLTEATDCPLIIVLEDIQWADISSIQFLHFVVRNISKSRILVLATYDPDEPFSTGYGLNTLLEEMARELLFENLELQGLSEKEIKRLVEWYFPDADFSEAFFHSVYIISQGNPYLLRTTLELLLTEGVVVESQGKWSNTRHVEQYVRDSVMDMVRRRLMSVSDSNRAVLEYAATIGGRCITDLISVAMETTPADLQMVFGALEKDHRLLRKGESGYVFDHSLIGQAVYSGMNGERRKMVHQHIGAALEQIYGQDTDEQMYDLAFHYALSGDREKGLSCLEKAGGEARRSLAFQEALYFSTMGLTMLEDSPSIQDGDQRKMRLLMFAGEMKQILGRWEESMDDYQRTLVLTEKLKDEKIRGDAFMRIGLAYSNRGMWTEAESFYAKSTDVLQDIGAQKHLGLVRTYDADIKLGRCEWKRAKNLYEEALNTAMRTMNRRLMARIYSSLGAIADIRGDLMGAMVNYSKSLNLYKGLEEYLGMANVYRQLGNMHANGQKWEKALEFYDRSISLYDKVGEVGMMALAYLNKAVATLNLLAVGKAEKLCDLAQRYLIQVKDQRGLAECNKVFGFIGIRKGEWHYAQRRFEESLRILGLCGDSLGLAQHLSEIGSVYAVHDRNSKALELFQRAFDLYRELGIDNRVEELRIKIKSIASDTGPEKDSARSLKIDDYVMLSEKTFM